MTKEDLEILDLRGLERHPRTENLLRQFYLLCIENFPYDDEREDMVQWTDALWGYTSRLPAPEPLTHIVLAGYGFMANPSPIVVGGIVAEYYRNSCCGLLTYAAVSPEWRNRGIAGELMVALKGILNTDAEGDGNPLKAVFSEANDPRMVREASDSMKPCQRLQILAAMGAKWINIPYVQPKLSPEKSRVKHLLLLAFPAFAGGKVYITSSVLRSFLLEFYDALEDTNSSKDSDLEKMFSNLHADGLRLEELPAYLLSYQ
jgi:hypothetical protein